MGINALILAGDRTGYIPLDGRNKALLTLRGKTIIEYVISAVRKCTNVRNIFVVGPTKDLAFLNARVTSKRLMFIEQEDTLAANVLKSYDHICPLGDEHLMIMSSDIPFITPEEIDYFISNSAYEDYNIVMGFLTENALEKYYPDLDKPGIRMSLFYSIQAIGRLNNMFLYRPSASGSPELAGIIYRYRYQKRLSRYLGFLMNMMRSDVNRFSIFKTSLMFQAALQADHFGMYGLAHAIGEFIDLPRTEAIVSKALGLRFKTMFMDFGGAALDIDNEESLMTARLMFDEFMAMAKQRED